VRVEGTFLNSRLGRRVFALFCLAALLPVTTLWLLTGNAVDEEHARTIAESRTALAKAYALSVFERLDTAAQLVDRLPLPAQAMDSLAPLFVDVHDLERDRGDPVAAQVAAAAAQAPGARLLVLPAAGSGALPQVVVLRAGTAGGASRPVLAAVLSPTWLWGSPDEFQAGFALCVRDARGQALFCPAGDAARADAAAVSAWPLFLKAAFGADGWTFTVAPDQIAVEGKGGLLRTFGLVAASTVLLVTLLSLVQIRRTLVPLERLLERTRQVAAGSYAPLRLPRNTEFGELGAAFDEMAARIERQLGTLRALAEVDRRILTALDLDAIIALVLDRAHRIAPGAGMSVLHFRAPEAGLLDIYRGASGAGEAHRERLQCDPPLLRRLGHDADGGWRLLAPDDPWHALLRAAGIEPHRILPLQVRQRPVGAVALDLAADLDPELLDELRELGERVAVALAAKQRDDLLVFQARHDALTGLPNRFDATETLATALARAANSGTRVAVMFIDLDRFKPINDGLGHAAGDAVLAEVARLLGQHLPPGAYLARYGGDEFIAVLTNAGEPAGLGRIASALAHAVSAPIRVGATELQLQCSIGIAVHPDDGTQAEDLLRNADIAMYRAKRAGRGQYVFFEERMNVEAATSIRLLADLRVALRERRLHLEFQPRVDTRDGRIVAVEALARWLHPDEGPVPPALFIRLAEEAGLIDALGEWALDEACRCFASWRAAGVAIQSVSVNVSSQQLASARIEDYLRDALARHRMAPGELEIEITESVIAGDFTRVAARLEKLRGFGASIAIDDFGTGYSSLAYLRRLPFDTLKIDRSFLVDMVASPAALALVRAIVAMGDALGKVVVAEGVEDDEQVAVLRAWGCHFVQGFAFYQPMAAPRLLDELSAGGGRVVP
jgi:diguanylate cyclase (GGDEF)-like protein